MLKTWIQFLILAFLCWVAGSAMYWLMRQL